MSTLKQILRTDAPPATIFVRLLVGSVFLSEGIQKFLYPSELAAGRFEKIGIPFPQIMGAFVGGMETVCGALIILGLLTRLAAIPLLIDSSMAILSTKIHVAGAAFPPHCRGWGLFAGCLSESAIQGRKTR